SGESSAGILAARSLRLHRRHDRPFHHRATRKVLWRKEVLTEALPEDSEEGAQITPVIPYAPVFKFFVLDRRKSLHTEWLPSLPNSGNFVLPRSPHRTQFLYQNCQNYPAGCAIRTPFLQSAGTMSMVIKALAIQPRS